MYSTMVSTLASRPRVRIPAFPFQRKSVGVAEFNEWRCLEESGQWLENVDRTYLKTG